MSELPEKRAFTVPVFLLNVLNVCLIFLIYGVRIVVNFDILV